MLAYKAADCAPWFLKQIPAWNRLLALTFPWLNGLCSSALSASFTAFSPSCQTFLLIFFLATKYNSLIYTMKLDFKRSVSQWADAEGLLSTGGWEDTILHVFPLRKLEPAPKYSLSKSLHSDQRDKCLVKRENVCSPWPPQSSDNPTSGPFLPAPYFPSGSVLFCEESSWCLTTHPNSTHFSLQTPSGLVELSEPLRPIVPFLNSTTRGLSFHDPSRH